VKRVYQIAGVILLLFSIYVGLESLSLKYYTSLDQAQAFSLSGWPSSWASCPSSCYTTRLFPSPNPCLRFLRLEGRIPSSGCFMRLLDLDRGNDGAARFSHLHGGPLLWLQMTLGHRPMLSSWW